MLVTRHRWIHLPDPQTPPNDLARRALTVFVDMAAKDRFADQSLMSVFTPTYCTGERVMRPYRWLCGQSHAKWEWVVHDDSPDGDDACIADVPEAFAFWFCSCRVQRHRGREFCATNDPSVNARTVRNIVGMPNHVRAWRREAYGRSEGTIEVFTSW